MVVDTDELSIDFVGYVRDCIEPIFAGLLVTDTKNLAGSHPFIQSFVFLIVVMMFGTFTIGMTRGRLLETIESGSVQAL